MSTKKLKTWRQGHDWKRYLPSGYTSWIQSWKHTAEEENWLPHSALWPPHAAFKLCLHSVCLGKLRNYSFCYRIWQTAPESGIMKVCCEFCSAGQKPPAYAASPLQQGGTWATRPLHPPTSSREGCQKIVSTPEVRSCRSHHASAIFKE